MGRCRFCYVKKDREFLKDIFNHEQTDLSIPKIVQMLTNLTITKTDPYTKLACLNCFNILVLFHHCRKTILETNRLFVENENNKNCIQFERNNDEELILSDDNSCGIAENSLRLKSDSDDDSCNQQLENNSYIARDNKKSFGLIKDKMDIGEIYSKIGNYSEDKNQKIVDNQHSNISDGSSNNETTCNDNKNSNDYYKHCTEDGSSTKNFFSIMSADFHKNQSIQKDNSYSYKPVDDDNETTSSDNTEKRTEQLNQCNICGKIFSSKYNLSAHFKKHTGDKPHQCNICGKKFTLRCDLKRHLVTHSGERPYQCNICRKEFSSKYNLAAHFKQHTGEKPHQCNVCDKRFTLRCGLRRHFLTHTGERPYQCSICKKKFTNKSNLSAHYKKHTGERPYQCNICNKRFTLKGNLKKHSLIHCG